MDWKIFSSVLAALGVAAVFWAGWHRYDEYRQLEALQAFEASRPHYTQADVWVSPTPAPAKPRVVYRYAPLASDEQCIGGTVVRVSGSTYVQALAPDGRPWPCEGRSRVTAR